MLLLFMTQFILHPRKVEGRYREGICKVYVSYMLDICKLYVKLHLNYTKGIQKQLKGM